MYSYFMFRPSLKSKFVCLNVDGQLYLPDSLINHCVFKQILNNIMPFCNNDNKTQNKYRKESFSVKSVNISTKF